AVGPGGGRATPHPLAGGRARRGPRGGGEWGRRCLRGGCWCAAAGPPPAPSTRQKPMTPGATAGAAMRACQRRDTASVQPRSRAGFTSSRVAQGPATRRRRPMRFSCPKASCPHIAALPWPSKLSSFRKTYLIRDVILRLGAFAMENRRATRGLSTIVNRTVTPRRPRNVDLREREYLTPKEVDRLQHAAGKHSRYGHRDATAILIAYRHGLRACELCELTWNMIELDSGRIHVRRAKNGVDSTHPLTGKEIRALRQLRRENLQSRFVFNTERGGPVTRAWFLKMVRRTGE